LTFKAQNQCSNLRHRIIFFFRGVDEGVDIGRDDETALHLSKREVDRLFRMDESDFLEERDRETLERKTIPMMTKPQEERSGACLRNVIENVADF